jgi:serine/threonine protein kinase
MHLEPGVVVAEHYRLEERVGKGGSGTVWCATDLMIGRTVAIKILHTDLRKDDALRERFHREARLVSSIEHPAIVPIHHLGVVQDEDEQRPCIVMPFVQGQTLAQHLEQRGKLPLTEAIRWMRDLLDALSVAHAIGIIHRDLKPQNLVLESRNSGTVLRLLDFGIAKNLSALPTAGSVLAARAGMLLGTPEYISPEQIRNPSAVDGRADLWAAGVIFYEMLTGRPPFTGANQVEVIGKVLHESVPRASDAEPTLPPAVDVLFARIFDRNLDSRFRTALQLAEAIAPLARAASPSGTAAITPTAPDGARASADTRSRRWAGFSDPSRPDQPTPSQPLSRPALASAATTAAIQPALPSSPAITAGSASQGSGPSTGVRPEPAAPRAIVTATEPTAPHAIVTATEPTAQRTPSNTVENPRADRRPTSLFFAGAFAVFSVLTLLVALALTRR